ncbi:MAG TPA: hypothetical protein VF460_03490 [Burkholderiales bacterium]
MNELRMALFAVLYCFATALIGAEYEYDGNCAEALAHGHKIATNCSIVWTSDSGKTYCFGSSGAKDQFLGSPGDSLAKAEGFWNDPEYWKAQVKLREAEARERQQ